MSDDLDIEEEQPEEPNDGLKQLRQQAKKAREHEQRAERAERALMFAEAGLNISDPKVKKYFIPGYDGDLTPEAIKAAAEADGFLGKSETPTIPQEEVLRLQGAAAATEGAETPAPADYTDEFRKLSDTARQENWDPDRFSLEIARTVQRLGGPVNYDGIPEYLPDR